jgi:hypothetical protein
MSLSQRSEYFANGAFVFAFLPTFLGINAIVRPDSALSIFNFKAPPQVSSCDF